MSCRIVCEFSKNLRREKETLSNLPTQFRRLPAIYLLCSTLITPIRFALAIPLFDTIINNAIPDRSGHLSLSGILDRPGRLSKNAGVVKYKRRVESKAGKAKEYRRAFLSAKAASLFISHILSVSLFLFCIVYTFSIEKAFFVSLLLCVQ